MPRPAARVAPVTNATFPANGFILIPFHTLYGYVPYDV